MLTINAAIELLNLCPICTDIQYKILMLFIGINGTPTSNIMKSQIKFSDTNFNGTILETIVLEDDMTLWKIKAFLNSGGYIFKFLRLKTLNVIYELRIAYLTNKYSWENFDSISSLLESIKDNTDSELFLMFYNLDKTKYNYLGTQTANIIHQAILDKNIKKFDPMIWYDKYDDEYSDEYY